MSQGPTWEFGLFHLYAAPPQLWRGTEQVRLSPKALAVLTLLVQHGGFSVSKETLLDTVWPDVTVGEAVLAVSIRELRQALGDSARQSSFIETVHRYGYRFIAPVTYTEAQQSEPAPLVGREAALAQVQTWWQRACAGTRQVGLISGEPGLGKTSLVNAFVRQIRQETSLWLLRGQCIEQYGAGEAYLPLLDALGHCAREDDGRRLVKVLEHHAPSWLVHLPSLLSIGEHEALQRRVQRATADRMLREMGHALEALALERPVVLVLEDLHWSDGATLDVLTWLARRVNTARLLVVGTYRPVEVLVRDHPLQRVKQELLLHGLCAELPLDILSESAVAAYVATRDVERVLPARLIPLLHAHTGGNPLFLVHVVERLLAQGTGWASDAEMEAAVRQVPENVRGLIEQHVAQCSDLERQVLAAASVAGAEFAVATVAAAADLMDDSVEQCCAQLARLGQFLEASDVEEWPDSTLTGGYRFRHALYQQTVYEQLAASQRVQLHRRIGQRLEAGYTTQTALRAAELARHFEQGRLPELATFYHQQAGENASRRGAHRQAIDHFRCGLELLATLPDTMERREQLTTLHLKLGMSLIAIKGQTAAEVERLYTTARTLCQQGRDTSQRFWALVGLRKYYTDRRRLTTARELGEECVYMAQRLAHPLLQMVAHYELGNPLFWLGEVVRARDHLEQCAALSSCRFRDASHEHLDLDPGVGSLMYLGSVLWLLGYPKQAQQRCQAAIALAETLRHPYSLTMAHFFAAKVYQYCRAPEATLYQAEQALDLAAEYGFTAWEATAGFRKGWALASQGQALAGMTQMQQSLTALQGIGDAVGASLMLALLADACAGQSQVEEGFQLMATARRLLDTGEEAWSRAEVLRLHGELLLQQARPDYDAAAICLQQALHVSRRQNAKSWELRAAMSLVRLEKRQGTPYGARQRLAEVYAQFTEGFDTADLQDARHLLTAS